MQKRYENSKYVERNREVLVDIKGASVSIGEDPLLRDVNLKVSEGDFVYIIGRVGSGKSTLLKTLYAEKDFDEGEATVMGRDLTKIKRRHVPELRRQMGIVFQDFALLRRSTVNQNLDFVLRATGWKKKTERDERIKEVLELVGLAERGEDYPHELSGGEQQRVAIARAILNRPRLIIADEPTGNLDAETARAITQLLHSFAEGGQAVVMVTHNMSHLKHFPGKVYECRERSVHELSRKGEKPAEKAPEAAEAPGSGDDNDAASAAADAKAAEIKAKADEHNHESAENDGVK